jgi:hypothetical protein
MPTGHTFSRKALVDALLSGCIPVVFHLCSLHYLMPEFVNISTAISISIYFPATLFIESNAIHHARHLLQWLVAIRNSEETLLKRERIADIAWNLQYSHTSGQKNDAFDSFVTKAFRRVRRIKRRSKQDRLLNNYFTSLFSFQLIVIVVESIEKIGFPCLFSFFSLQKQQALSFPA